jgi:parallel beta-helix repeat protein
VFIGLLVNQVRPEVIQSSLFAYTYAQSIAHMNGSCIPSGDHSSIQNALTGVGAEAVLCPDAVFELGETIFFTADSQQIYTEGFPTDSTRAFLEIVGDTVATAVNGEHYDYVALRNVIIDGNRPELGIADGALINFGRGIEDRDVLGQTVEWVRAYEPRGWTVIYLGGICSGAIVKNNELGPAGRAEYCIADGISVECPNSIVEYNTIVDATDGGIVIFQSPGSLIANNTIRAENRIMFYGISMEDYYPLEGDFTGTQVTNNVIDAAGAQIRRGIGMGPHVGCHPEGEPILRSRGAVITGNTLMGDHMAYGFVISGVEDWTVTGNVDLSTHLTPIMEGDCQGTPADPPAGFQYDARTSSGTFQPEFEAAVLGGSTEMWPLAAVIDEPCLADLIGEALLDSIRDGEKGPVWIALESAPGGERIDQCISIFEPPDISDLTGNVGYELLPCEPYCLNVRMFNLSDDTADMRGAVFLLESFSVPCVGLPDSLGPWEEINCVIDDFVADGFQVLQSFGFRPDYGFWAFSYPLDPVIVTPDETGSLIPKSFLMSQNYPNPFNPSTTIDFTIAKGGAIPVLLNIYDLRGRLMRTLIDEEKSPGRYSVHWNWRDNLGGEVSSGLYLYRIEAGSFSSIRKMTILR